MDDTAMGDDSALTSATRRGIVSRLAGMVAGLGVIGLAARHPAPAAAKERRAPKGTLIRTERVTKSLLVPSTAGQSVTDTLTCPVVSAKERSVLYSGGVSLVGSAALIKSWALDVETWQFEVRRLTGNEIPFADAAITCGYYRK